MADEVKPDTLEQAVSKAIEVEEGTPAATTEGTVETPATEEVKEIELSDLEKAQAIDLWKGLKNKETQGSIVEFLAKQGGYTKAEAKEAVKEAVQIVKEINSKDVLTEALGEEYAHLIDKLGPAFDKILENKFEKTTQSIEALKNETKSKELEQESLQGYTALCKEYYTDGKMPQEVQTVMSDLMDNFLPAKEMSVDDYLKTVYFAALGKLGKPVPSKSVAAAATRAITKTRIPGELTTGGRPTAATVNAGKMSLGDAVQAALESIEKSK